ncbi:MAG: manganese efflux pump [Bacteroidaceae bacterium]|nr:manganese efflux pump [Bacteroidaceae bacterium]
MTLFSLIVLAIGLCMDSFAVSLTSGTLMRPFTMRRACKFALIMALFQGLMPVVGWLLGVGFREYIEAYDHWIALALLLYLGGRMIYEALQQEECQCFDPCCTRTAMTMGLATSIDAMAVGISLSFLHVDIVQSAIVIGITTFIFSMAGLLIGKKIGCYLKKGAEIIGGIILILIGVKICIEHLFFA